MKKKTKKTKSAVKISEPEKDRDLLVTKRFLDFTKQELKGDITSLRLEMKAGFTNVDSKFEDIKVQLSKMMIMMENQNDRNLAAHDKNALIYQRIVDNDSRFEKNRRTSVWH